jgi:hypothetical protein
VTPTPKLQTPMPSFPRFPRFLLSLFFSALHVGLAAASAASTQDKKLFFAASPPFHGNALLSELLATCPNVVTKYCDKPSMGGDLHHAASSLGLTGTYEKRRAAKLPAMQSSIDNTPKGFGYADMSPNFATGWHDIVLRDLASAHPITILLVRDALPRALGRLQARRASISPWHVTNSSSIYSEHFGSGGFFPVYSQHSRLASTRPLLKWENANDDELLVGYLVDFEARRQNIRAVAERRRRVNVVDVWLEELLDPDSVIYLLHTKMRLKSCNVTTIRALLGAGPSKSIHLPLQIPLDIVQANTKIIDNYVAASRNASGLSIAVPSLHRAAISSRDLRHGITAAQILDATGHMFSIGPQSSPYWPPPAWPPSSPSFSSPPGVDENDLIPAVLHQGMAQGTISSSLLFFTNPVQFGVAKEPFAFVLRAHPGAMSWRRPDMRSQRTFFLNSSIFAPSSNESVSHVVHPVGTATIATRIALWGPMSRAHGHPHVVLKIGSCPSRADMLPPQSKFFVVCHAFDMTQVRDHSLLYRIELSIHVRDSTNIGATSATSALLVASTTGWFSLSRRKRIKIPF